MKKAIIYMLLFIGGWSISSCRKEYSIENGNALTSNFVATIDGAHWQSAVSTEQVTIMQGLINITGISADNQEISMTLTGTSTGVYEVGYRSTSLATFANIDSSFVYAYNTGEAPDTAQPGEVNITDIDQLGQTMSGTFSFNAYRSADGGKKTITQGSFTRLPFTTGQPTTRSGDTVTATIDNKVWVGKNVQATVNASELTIIGSSADGSQSIGLLMPSNSIPGSYPLDGSNPSYVGVYTVLANSTTSGLVSTAGLLTITQNNTATSRISGTFRFTAANPLNPTVVDNITSGYFSVYYGP
ncbi:MAG TPA: DUF6252 family protein [Puia sp.]|jgi:hypothetical protein|nr:DUF6252 family protein [Puia sp.]